jgi:sugar phosphate isomerase/epimerase
VQIDRIGLSLGSLRQPLKQALLTAARVGARGVELDARSDVRPADMSRTAIRHFRKWLDDLNLRVCGVSFPTRRGYAAAEDLDRRLEATQSAMRLAHDLGSKWVILNIGPVGATGSDELNTLVESLTGLASVADRVGARVAAMTDADNAPELARLLSLLPDGALGIAVHPANVIRSSAQLPEVVTALGASVSYVYASDAVRGVGGLGVRETELGRGAAELPEVLGRLEEFGYQGWVTIDRRQTPLSAEQAEDAVTYLRSL